MMLRPVKDLSVRIQGAKYVTISELPLLWSSIINQLTAMAPPSADQKGPYNPSDQIFRTQTGVALRNRLVASLQIRGKCHLTGTEILLASLLDPRYKPAFTLSPASVWFVPIDHQQRTITKLRELEQKLRADDGKAAPLPPLPPVRLPLPPVPASGPGLRIMQRPMPAIPAAAAAAAAATAPTEVDIYLKMDDDEHSSVPENERDMDYVLKWWKEHADKLPVLAKIAKRYLAIPATSAEPERVWSAAALLCSDLRGSLSTDSVENQLFLQRNKNLLDDTD
jgi:hypothetical protein